MSLRVAENGRLQTAERKFAVVVNVECSRKVDELAVAVFTEAADGGSGGVLEPEQLAALVESFAGGVIAGASDASVLETGFFEHQFRVSTRNGECQKRRLDFRVREPRGGKVTF